MNTKSLPRAAGEAAHKAHSLPAFMFPLRSIYVASRGGAEIWTRWDGRPGSKNNFVLCECQNPEEAAFIVRACNSHAALVAALERALERIKYFDEDYDLDSVYIAGRAALTAAKRVQS